MRALLLLLAGCSTSPPAIVPSAPPPVFVLADDLALTTAACVAFHDGALYTVEQGPSGFAKWLTIAHPQGHSFLLEHVPVSPLRSVATCAISPAGQVALAGSTEKGDAVTVNGAVVSTAASVSALLWLDEARLLIGRHGEGAQTWACDGKGNCAVNGRDPPQPVLMWSAFGTAPLPAHYVNRFDSLIWQGKRAIFDSNDYDQNAIFWADTLVGASVSEPFQHGLGAMGAASLALDGNEAIVIANTPTSRLFVHSVDVSKEWDVEAATANRSSWSPLVRDFNGDGAVDLFFAASLTASDDAAFFDAVTSGGANTETAIDVVLTRDGDHFTPTYLPHRTKGGGFTGCQADAADLDGDGLPELAVACSVNGVGELRVYWNRTKGPRP